MCGRYNFNSDVSDEKMVAIVGMMERNWPGAYKTGEIFPGDIAPAVIERDGKIVAVPAVFGFPGFRDGKLLINARSETAAEKRSFSESLRTKRMILPHDRLLRMEPRREQDEVPVHGRLPAGALSVRAVSDRGRTVPIRDPDPRGQRIHDRDARQDAGHRERAGSPAVSDRLRKRVEDPCGRGAETDAGTGLIQGCRRKPQQTAFLGYSVSKPECAWCCPSAFRLIPFTSRLRRGARGLRRTDPR